VTENHQVDVVVRRLNEPSPPPEDRRPFWLRLLLSVSKQFPMTVKETLEECAHALRVLDPATYGARRTTATSEVDGYLPK